MDPIEKRLAALEARCHAYEVVICWSCKFGIRQKMSGDQHWSSTSHSPCQWGSHSSSQRRYWNVHGAACRRRALLARPSSSHAAAPWEAGRYSAMKARTLASVSGQRRRPLRSWRTR